jgi:integrase
MVSGHLTTKKGNYYAVLNLVDANGKRKPKWIPTGIPAVRGNKKKADARLQEERQRYNLAPQFDDEDILFADYMEEWLEIIKTSIAPITYASYTLSVKTINDYFHEKKITLRGLQAKDIQGFYQEQLKRVKASTVLHYHANIHKALKHAVKMDMIATNPSDKVERPKKDKFTGSFYDSDELAKLFEIVKDTPLELPVLFSAFYGLRRSEAIGLKWASIDFKNDTITIEHTVTSCSINGKHVELAQDTTKTQSSRRTLPLVPFFKEKLLALREEQAENRRLCGRSYSREFLDYVCVDVLGERIKTNYVTTRFPIVLRQNDMRRIRFHDLRHSCASLMLANGVSMKQVQEWLGHSDFSTTANIYAHLDFSSKVSSANALSGSLGL